MITYLELLEMMRDGTQPKKIIYDGCEYEWKRAFHEYCRKGKENEFSHFYQLFGDIAKKLITYELITEKIIKIID